MKGRKWHALLDTDGRAIKLQVHAAVIQDRNGAGRLLRLASALALRAAGLRRRGPHGPRVATASPLRVEIAHKPHTQAGIIVNARRWVVERFFAWINRNRRLARNVEATIASAKGFLYAASVPTTRTDRSLKTIRDGLKGARLVHFSRYRW